MSPSSLSVSALAKPRVLVVDDSASSREALCSSLHRSGFDTAEANEGSEGLWRARMQTFQAILTDIHMPTMGGIEFIRELRKLPGYSRTPVFVLTSDVSRSRFLEGREVGATAWLIKPANLVTLMAVVRDAMSPS